MNKLLKPLCLTATVSAIGLTLSAQTVSEFPPLLRSAAETAQTALPSGRMRAPLNTERELGVHIFGATNYDYDRAHHYTWLWSEKHYNLDKIATVYREGDEEEEYEPSMYRLVAGAWLGDAYYGFRVKDYTYVTYIDSWVRVNPFTGEWSVVNNLSNYKSNWPRIVDIALNPKTGVTYGLAENDNGTVSSRIMLINKTEGIWAHTVKSLDEYYFAGSFNYDGKLYAIRWTYTSDGTITGTQLDIFDEDFEVESSFPITVDGRAFISYYQHGLEFDYTTGDLWWTATNYQGEQYLVKINPDDGTTVNKGVPGIGESLVGLYIDYKTAESRTAPALVSGLSCNVDFDGANKVELSWTNPTTQWNRFSLKNLAEVRIYRDNYDSEPVATLDATDKAGQQMSWTDQTTQGIHKYYVVACAPAGVRGVPDDINVFVGKDAPGPVNNLFASTSDGKSVNLSWSVPTIGDNDGWFDDSNLTYTITRLPDGAKFERITGTSWTDKDIPEVQSYSYLVAAVNAEGTGTAVESNALIAGQSVLVPFRTDFATKVDADRFTVLDKNYDGLTFVYDFNTNRLRNTLKLLSDNSSNDDILVSPALSVKKGMSYRVVYTMSAGCYGSSDRIMFHDFAFTGGNAATIEGQSKILGRLEEYETEGNYPEWTLTNYFTAEETGEYYVGLEILTKDEEYMWYYVEGFEITEAHDDDLAAEKLETYLHTSTIKPNQFKVHVLNNGNNRQTNYEVQVAAINRRGERVVIASTTDVPALNSHASAVISLTGNGGQLGMVDYVGIVKLDGDGNSDNNETPAVTVQAEEADPFNLTINRNNEITSTLNPMNHFSAATASQTIYTPALTGLKSDEPLRVTRLAWEYEGRASFDGTIVKVYLETTDKAGFASGETTFIPVTSEPYFATEFRVETGTHYVVADLDDVFEFDPSKNLLVTVSKYETGHSDYLMVFRAFDNNWNLAQFHSMTWKGANEFVPASRSNTGTRYPEAPVLHMAIENYTAAGIDDIAVVEGGSVYYDPSESALVVNYLDVTSVSAYTVDGQLYTTVANTAKSDRISINLPTGSYILSANLASGRTVSVKVMIR
ncbi:MAG: hypothetical protein NC336_06995 [Clostridium sp.]|nr:hypothetical protein [Clostridium sp.]